MYGEERQDMRVRPAWDREPPTVYVDLPAGAATSELEVKVTTDAELYISCPDPTERPGPDWARDVTEQVLSMVDLPEALVTAGSAGRGVVSERAPLPDVIADQPDRYTAAGAANNGVVTLRFEEEY